MVAVGLLKLLQFTYARAVSSADPLCFDNSDRTEAKCCGASGSADCKFQYGFSRSYCCSQKSSCYAWGVSIDGADLEVEIPALPWVGIFCQYLCQTKPTCKAWTMTLSDYPDESLRQRCFLKSRLWSTEEWQAPFKPGIVSGTRHCPSNQSELIASLYSYRTTNLMGYQGDNVVYPEKDPDTYVARAVEAVLRNGWVVVRGGLATEKHQVLRAAAQAVEDEIVGKDPQSIGNRSPRRYSYGSASQTRHQVHLHEWASLFDIPLITPVLRELFKDAYVVSGGGGDLVLGETDTLQWLHTDMSPVYSELYDGMHDTIPGVVANYVLTNVSCADGPMRLIANTQTLNFIAHGIYATSPQKENAMMDRLNLTRVLLCPLQPGDVTLRDYRLWHAGSANFGLKSRPFPNTEILATWMAEVMERTSGDLAPRPAIPDDVWSQLSPHAQRLSEKLRAPGPVNGTVAEGFAFPLIYGDP
eukprot:gnl/TRDRNA2_/TRDRNA2_189287_c0_seq1.p1 gnl/TRDRNA2_/TRDRNA2_189287_c0~~gnl/TRDRNA2_/TRDRNA2_189287_c0_seq1.p1  ORF type:complete len:495 (+),score=65.89 gnl/TRDRNA2_/TRDRNA2_189287_c0_seq1:73-1485(+)